MLTATDTAQAAAEALAGWIETVVVTVDARPDSSLRARAADLGVEVGPVSLQTLVVRAGIGSPTHPVPTGVPSC